MAAFSARARSRRGGSRGSRPGAAAPRGSAPPPRVAVVEDQPTRRAGVPGGVGCEAADAARERRGPPAREPRHGTRSERWVGIARPPAAPRASASRVMSRPAPRSSSKAAPKRSRRRGRQPSSPARSSAAGSSPDAPSRRAAVDERLAPGGMIAGRRQLRPRERRCVSSAGRGRAASRNRRNTRGSRAVPRSPVSGASRLVEVDRDVHHAAGRHLEGVGQTLVLGHEPES